MAASREISLAHSQHQQLVGVIALSKKSFVVMGKLLHELYQSGNYQYAVGEGIESWGAYLAQPEINLTKAEADRLMQIYEWFVINFGVDESELETVPIKALHYLLPIAKRSDAEEVLPLLDEARELSQRDFRERVHELKHGENSIKTYEYMVMRKCVETGSMQKIHGLDSDTIKEALNLSE